ncbi:NUDIX domain-containing protein [Paenibacillus sp. TRM 82003]|uniref:NUDIX domain-containing protein n=1 Tax=Kineococcus sp. TRM81007 TaxID=2925831 RepID=UPI001F55B6C6|nr:NUDIX domain-containing protein [Kineococcus sp. TRM81007]MCI2237706.1 NUDIX domain-containing protein [Kineococcus sp. TRM81007]MCI3921724.1 NUDIX domain-containing protein [Paenibacillus sp. TRM 82003]
MHEVSDQPGDEQGGEPAPGRGGEPGGLDTGGERVALYDPSEPAGRVTGSAPRRRVRSRNLPHAATGVLLRDGHGRVFVHRRTGTKDVHPGAHDCLAGGVVGAGEDVEEAARRELAEELGVGSVALRPVLRRWYRDEVTHYLAHVYEAWWDGRPLVLQASEVAAGWWEPARSLRERLADPSWPFVPDSRALLAAWPRWWEDPGAPPGP